MTNTTGRGAGVIMEVCFGQNCVRSRVTPGGSREGKNSCLRKGTSIQEAPPLCQALCAISLNPPNSPRFVSLTHRWRSPRLLWEATQLVVAEEGLKPRSARCQDPTLHTPLAASQDFPLCGHIHAVRSLKFINWWMPAVVLNFAKVVCSCCCQSLQLIVLIRCYFLNPHWDLHMYLQFWFHCEKSCSLSMLRAK